MESRYISNVDSLVHSEYGHEKVGGWESDAWQVHHGEYSLGQAYISADSGVRACVSRQNPLLSI